MVGGILWPGARVLYEWLTANSSIVVGKRVVELGSGTGACGLCCGALGASQVVLTDKVLSDMPIVTYNVDGSMEEVNVRSDILMELVEENIALNREALGSCEVRSSELLWGDLSGIGVVKGALGGAADVVVGSDVTYHPSGHRDLFATARSLLEEDHAPDSSSHESSLASNGRFIFSHQLREGWAPVDVLKAAATAAGLTSPRLVRPHPPPPIKEFTCR